MLWFRDGIEDVKPVVGDVVAELRPRSRGLRSGDEIARDQRRAASPDQRDVVVRPARCDQRRRRRRARPCGAATAAVRTRHARRRRTPKRAASSPSPTELLRRPRASSSGSRRSRRSSATSCADGPAAQGGPAKRRLIVCDRRQADREFPRLRATTSQRASRRPTCCVSVRAAASELAARIDTLERRRRGQDRRPHRSIGPEAGERLFPRA